MINFRKSVCTVILLCAGGTVFGQIDTARNAGSATQLEEGPSRTKQSPAQNLQFRKEDRVEVSKDEMPAELVVHLRNEKKYEGWDKNPVYLDRNSKAYIIYVMNGTSSKTYRLSENGALLKDDQ